MVAKLCRNPVYPLAIPSIANPGAMLTVTGNSKFSTAEQAETVLQIAIIFAILLGLLFSASRIIAVIGKAGASVVSRVMGVTLARVAMDGIIKAMRVVLTGELGGGRSSCCHKGEQDGCAERRLSGRRR